MPANFWPEDDSSNELAPLNSLLSDLSATEESIVETDPLFLPFRFQGRRRKAALVLTIVWSSTIALHLVSWGSLFVLGLTTILGIHALEVVFTRPRRHPKKIEGDLPSVSVMVAAKNEEAVISRLVKSLCSLDYPDGKYELWVIDDNSSDRTPQLLTELAKEYKQLKTFRRSAQATGGKSGALNQVLPLTKGEIIAVFDADAQVSPELLHQVVPLFQKEQVGAVQVRKAIANAKENFWTKGQMAEMAVDTYFQQQRTALGGIGELRGNGQFVRRTALESCGGWNEETITDDLDLTLRLHLDNWDIDCVFSPAVEEEGVTNAIALWHQRNRWAEGGYQRYLDYWDLLLKNRLGTRKTWDLLSFMLIMYILPTAAIPDLLMAIALHRPPIFGPITGLSVSLSVIGMFTGLHRIHQGQKFQLSTYLVLLLQTLRGTLYMFHWFVVMSSTTARMSFRPKRLKWVKTVHTGVE
ncbi:MULTISPECIES: glycosyltransferase [unclassified Tolypothrix]|uniref:glycosyltransferase n=1 Tax=unclassified Tolypothrix TaxID=2649714 RepID=UPI0005EABDBF|nr:MULTISPECIES: glycosyltransferase family 2 protein [unclassified Tolypothrix]BAY94151.1 glycosyl transferase family protein [Microchaete diplosiphon NIES-3275]EKF03786.1 glycosyltransferase, group 2 family protein [Tolypothrix sp. PCC 7601]MBE9084958.1 glycosyltransferase family 2 protein [Tolypothrix sp. LEGE 11397]UYD27904.1 glycosyltransferase family 2 protein [Tolypothrix sp. PCC 7712]UYD36228.1 glycosyltransferase family 2 protein [Tolypothrix sp. PCC 7601]